MPKFLQVRFRGRKFLFTGKRLKDGGAICTKAAYRSGDLSYADMKADGTIWRFKEQIGSRKDVRIIGRVDAPKPQALAMANLWMNLSNLSMANMGVKTLDAKGNTVIMYPPPRFEVR